jgi:hypothetical protein
MDSYSMGEVLEGSYEGYAYIEIPAYTSQAEMEAAGYDISNATVTFDAQGRPTLSGKNAAAVFTFPQTDNNGHQLPAGNGSESYGVYRYSLTSKTGSQGFLAAANATTTRHNTPIGSGNVEISKLGSGNSEQYVRLDLQGYSEVDENDVLMFKVLQRPSGGKGRYTSWFLNETKDEDKAPIGVKENGVLLQDYETRWGASNLNLALMKVAVGGNTTGDITFHSGAVYERSEYVLRSAIGEAEKVLLGANEYMNYILEDLNLITEVSEGDFTSNKVEITWSSSNEDVISNDGSVTVPTASAENVRLVATYSYGDKQKHIAYDLVVVGGMDDATIVEWAADNLTWESLTTETPGRITTGFNLPNVQNVFGTDVFVDWEVIEGEDAAEIVGTRLEPIRGEADSLVRLKATLSYRDVQIEKSFDFTVAKDEITISYVNDDYAAMESGEILDKNIEITSLNTESSYVQYENGKGIRVYGVNGADGNENSATAIIKIPNKASENELMDFYNNFESNTVYEFTVGYEADSTSLESETHVKLLDDKGKMITFLQLRGSRKGNEATTATINLKQNDAWTNGIPTIQPFITGKYRAGYSGGSLPELTFRIVYNRVSTAYDIYLKLANDPDSEYVLFYKDALPTESVARGSVVDAISVSASTNASRSGAITLRDLKVYTTDSIVVAYILENMSAQNILNGQAANSVTKDLSLLSPHYGFDFSIDVESDYSGQLINPITGKLAEDLVSGDAYNATITPKVVGNSGVLKGIVVKAEPFEVIVRGFDTDSILFGRIVSVTGATAQSGHSSFINDGIQETAFVTTGTEKGLTATVDIGSNVLFNKFVISEGKIGDSYNIGNWFIEASTNRRNWVTVAQGQGIEGTKTVVTPSPYEPYRYVRLNISDKNELTSAISLNEFAVYFEPDEAHKTKQDFDALTAPPSSATSDFYVQGIGSIYGTKFIWTSADTSILSIGSLIEDSSSPYYGMYKVTYTKPSKGSYVTLKAIAGSESKSYSINIPVGSLGGRPSGGGGSGGGSGSGVIGTLSDITPVTPPSKPSKYFDDVAETSWAGKYIDTLKEAGVVSGDGEGRYNPNNHITRAEFVKMIVFALGIDTTQYEGVPFSDVGKDMWFYEYATAAYHAGIVSGVSEVEFAPNDKITRQDMAVILSRAAEKHEVSFDEKEEVADFADLDKTDSYAVEAVRIIQRYGIINGDSSGRFNGKNFATRAETAKMIYPFVTGSVE